MHVNLHIESTRLLRNSLSLTHTQIHPHTHSLSLTHTHIHTHTHSLSLSHTHRHTQPSLSRSHTHTSPSLPPHCLQWTHSTFRMQLNIMTGLKSQRRTTS